MSCFVLYLLLDPLIPIFIIQSLIPNINHPMTNAAKQ